MYYHNNLLLLLGRKQILTSFLRKNQSRYKMHVHIYYIVHCFRHYCRLTVSTAVSTRRMVSKLCGILENNLHPLHNVLLKCRSTFSAGLIPPKCTTGQAFLWPSNYTTSEIRQSDQIHCLFIISIFNFIFMLL